MSAQEKARWIDRGFRLLLMALVLLWIIFPPQSASPGIARAAPKLENRL